MTLPAPYQSVFEQWGRQGIRVTQDDWTTRLKRHVGARVECDGELRFAKLAIANKGDLDEPNMLNGMRREVWWSQVIHRLNQNDNAFPFTSPRVIKTNVNQQPFQDKVAWIIMEFVDGEPIVGWEPVWLERPIEAYGTKQFDPLFDAVNNSLLALDQVHPHTLEDLGLPPLPSPPHGMRRWEKKGLLDMKTAVLGNGAFDITNFWHNSDGQLVIMDNEFAGWYPPYDHLTYIYHRLFCNAMQPDLAKQLLGKYLYRAIYAQHPSGSAELLNESLDGFWNAFTKILKPRLLGGWCLDTFRRRLPPWHQKQRLRYSLLGSIWRKRYANLFTG